MIVRVISLDRQEGAGADMKGDMGKLDTAVLQRSQQALGEVETSRRCSNGSVLARKQGLIVFIVLLIDAALAGDIGRQGRHAGGGNSLVEGSAGPVEAQARIAAFGLTGDFRFQFTEMDDIAHAQAFGRADEGAPGGGVDTLVQIDLNSDIPATADSAGRACAVQGGRDDARIVEHHEIAGTQDGRQIPHSPIRQLTLGIDVKEPGCVTRTRWTQGNALLWEREIKIGYAHGAGVYLSPHAIAIFGV